ncbi:hypothetical protein FIBSPDRAFT_505528 [Athelia psychrophila]|uniref:Uncharacterized protein n=1 Tax=Athelia psychrophila TaxID=1759441 RepID=A0A167TP62_9AGAM|nr:hypothetical protein FIBSPDRAFT_505528 [Fibularhizoctonia sp. CBS 109695]
MSHIIPRAHWAQHPILSIQNGSSTILSGIGRHCAVCLLFLPCHMRVLTWAQSQHPELLALGHTNPTCSLFTSHTGSYINGLVLALRLQVFDLVAKMTRVRMHCMYTD